MSTRRGYYYITEEGHHGPFQTISEAREAASEEQTLHLSIIAVVTLETMTGEGAWETVH